MLISIRQIKTFTKFLNHFNCQWREKSLHLVYDSTLNLSEVNMTPILSSLLEAIEEHKLALSFTPLERIIDFPKLVGANLSIKHMGTERLNEWISLLEDPHTPMQEIMAVAAVWDDSNTESIAYYVEITDQLKEGLYISINAMGY